MGSGAMKDNKKLAYGLPAFVFVAGGVILYLNGAPALIGAASVIIGFLLLWLGLRSS